MKDYIVSVVLPVYNTEAYVEQTIKCILRQTIGFFDHIELILVNNATLDGAGEICERYAEEYPDNIRYVKLTQNQGPCGARNAGLAVAAGKYINFCDSDDLWECDALEKLVEFMEINGNEVDLVTGRVRHFEGREAWHGLDWKYADKSLQLVDVSEHPEYVQLHLGSALIKTEMAKRFRHDVTLYHAEDAKYLSQLILSKGKYGLCADAVFLYRTRATGGSVLQNVNSSVRWYHDTLQGVYRFLIDESIAKFGRVIEYVQYLVMYELQWRLGANYVAEAVDREAYVREISGLLMFIEDDVIWAQRTLWLERKLYALELKYKKKPEQIREVYPVCDGLFIKSALVFNDKLHIRGFVRFPYDLEYDELLMRVNGVEDIPVDFDAYNEHDDVFSMGKNLAHANTFFCILPCKENMQIQFVLRQGKTEIAENVKVFGNSKMEGCRAEKDRLVVSRKI